MEPLCKEQRLGNNQAGKGPRWFTSDSGLGTSLNPAARCTQKNSSYLRCQRGNKSWKWNSFLEKIVAQNVGGKKPQHTLANQQNPKEHEMVHGLGKHSLKVLNYDLSVRQIRVTTTLSCTDPTKASLKLLINRCIFQPLSWLGGRQELTLKLTLEQWQRKGPRTNPPRGVSGAPGAEAQPPAQRCWEYNKSVGEKRFQRGWRAQ